MSESPKPSPFSLGILVGGILFAGFAALVAAFFLYRYGFDLQWAMEQVRGILAFLEDRPLWLLGAIATLPGLGFPISPLLVLGGGVLARVYGIWASLALIHLAVWLCFSWSFFLAAYPLRGVVRAGLKYARIELPELSGRGQLQTALIIRATPGIPFAFQNVVLGVLRVSWVPYLIISICVNLFYVTGFVLFGEAFLSGNVKLMLVAVVIIVAVALGIKAFYRKSVNAPPDGEA